MPRATATSPPANSRGMRTAARFRGTSERLASSTGLAAAFSEDELDTFRALLTRVSERLTTDPILKS